MIELPLPVRAVDERYGYRWSVLRPGPVPRPRIENMKVSRNGWRYQLRMEGEAHIAVADEPWLVMLTGDPDRLRREPGVRALITGGGLTLHAQWMVGTDTCTDFRWWMPRAIVEALGDEIRPGLFPGAVRVTPGGEHETWIAL